MRTHPLAATTALALLLLPQGAPGQARPSGNAVLTVASPLTGAVGGVAVDRGGLVYVADFQETVYKITPDGRTSVFATGLYGASGNNIDSHGNLLQSNFFGHFITRIDRHGNQQVLAEGLSGPVGIAVDADDNLYVVNCQGNSVSKVTRADTLPWAVSEHAASDLFNCPNGITLGPDGNLYVVNYSDGRMLRVGMDSSVVEHAVIPGGGNGHVTVARGSLYATSFQGHRVYRVGLDGQVEHLAGTGSMGETDGEGPEASFSWPNGIAAGPLGDRLYLNTFINRVPPTVVLPHPPNSALRVIRLAGLAEKMQAALQSGGIEAMVALHDAWKTDSGTAGVFTEIEVNALGYGLANAGQAEAAMKVFELNARDYPNSWNAWDSLAEAHMNAGNTERAIELYEKSLELNPANTNGQAMLEKLRERR